MFTKFSLFMLLACISIIQTTETTTETISTTVAIDSTDMTANTAILEDSSPDTILTSPNLDISPTRGFSESVLNYQEETQSAPFAEDKIESSMYDTFADKGDDGRLLSETNLSQSPDNDLSIPNVETSTIITSNSNTIQQDSFDNNDLTPNFEESPNPSFCSNCRNVTFNRLSYTIKNEQVQISWDGIEEEDIHCQYNYNKQIRDINYIRHENFTGANISIKQLCGTYTFELTANNLCYQTASTTLTIHIMADTFDISPNETTSSRVLLNIITTNCPLDNYHIVCSKADKLLLYKNQPVIDQLLPHSNYSCKGYLYKQDHVVGETQFTIKTQQAAPSRVRNIHVSNITDSSLFIIWELPENINGILTEYEISLFGRPHSDPPMFCKHENYNKSIVLKDNLTNKNQTFISTELKGNYEYTIGIRAKTNDYGPILIVTAKTLVPVTEVDNLTNILDLPTQNSPVAHLRWTYPCKASTSIENVLFSIHVIEDSIPRETINKSVTQTDLLDNLTMDIRLASSKNYTLIMYTINTDTNIKSPGIILTFQTENGNTTMPTNVNLTIIHDLIRINWDKPEQVYGQLLYYQVNITRLEYLHKINCNAEDLDVRITTNSQEYHFFAKPHRKYLVEIAAITSEGDGIKLAQECETKVYQSEPIRNLTCDLSYPPNNTVILRYREPCDFNGMFDHYSIRLFDQQGNMHSEDMEMGLNHTIRNLKPDMYYEADVSITTEGNRVSESMKCNFTSFAGIPDSPNLNASNVIVNIYNKQVEVLLKDDYFQDDQGEVKYFAILLGIASKWDDQLVAGYWDGSYWPNLEFWNNEGITYQATPANWEPLKGGNNSLIYKLGIDNCTGIRKDFCNGPLLPSTDYFLVIRGYTNNGYQLSNKLPFRTVDDFDKTQNVVSVVGILAGMLVVVIIGAMGCLYWKRRPSKPTTIEEANQTVNSAEHHSVFPETVKIEEFPSFYNERKAYLLEEFESLSKVGADLDRNDGAVTENRKKNRYINILPYDCSRVPLQGTKSDYINASYIRGYSGEVEYIATQGPLESTSADFWLMVMNENCSVVAMVAQFEEQKKTKCHRYFPERMEQMELELEDGSELMVRCSYELNLDVYIERQILVQAHGKQLTVTHLQFLNWPDFGCPEGTTNMLHFTKRLRRHMEKNDSIAVVHCSAGVGRTGTLVAVDILLQTIRDGKDINIYGTVAELRNQRTKMVQADAQYFYVYKCILDEILQPVELTDIKPIDPIYENMENLIEMKVISKDNNNYDTTIEYLNERNEQDGETDAESGESLNDKQNIINTMKNEETKPNVTDES